MRQERVAERTKTWGNARFSRRGVLLSRLAGRLVLSMIHRGHAVGRSVGRSVSQSVMDGLFSTSEATRNLRSMYKSISSVLFVHMMLRTIQYIFRSIDTSSHPLTPRLLPLFHPPLEAHLRLPSLATINLVPPSMLPHPLHHLQLRYTPVRPRHGQDI